MAEAEDLDQPGATQDRILRAAALLFSERGYENTSLSQVARQANVSKALIFWHFQNKENLFRAALRRTIEPYFINVEALDGLDGWGQIERLIDLFYEFVRENLYSVRFLFTLILQQDRETDEVIVRVSELYRLFGGLLSEVIARGSTAGCFRPDVEPDLEASLILATLVGVFMEHFTNGTTVDNPSRIVLHLKRSLRERLDTRSGRPASRAGATA